MFSVLVSLISHSPETYGFDVLMSQEIAIYWSVGVSVSEMLDLSSTYSYRHLFP